MAQTRLIIYQVILYTRMKIYKCRRYVVSNTQTPPPSTKRNIIDAYVRDQ